MPQLKQLFQENRPGARAGAQVSVLVGWALLLLPLGNGFVHYSYDLPVMLGPKTTPDEVIIVKLDEYSLTELRQSYQFFDRTYHAQLLRKLTAAPARLVVFDIYFPESDPRTNDTVLAEAIRANGRVVLAADFSSIAGLTGGIVGPPLPVLREAAKGWGLSVVEYDTDPTIRKHYSGNEDYPSLSWRAAEVAGAEPTRHRETRLQNRWLKYFGDDGSLPAISYCLALQQSPEYFKDKVIFIGGSPKTKFLHEETDEFHTPYTHLGGPFMSGVEVNATTFLNLVRGEWLIRVSPWGELLLLTATGLLLGFGLSLFRPLPGAVVAVVAGLLTAAVGCLVFWYADFWFSWLLIAGAQVPAAWICALVWNTQKLAREKTVLERKITDLPGSTLLSPQTPGLLPPLATPSGPGSPLPPGVPAAGVDARGGTRLIATLIDYTLLRRIGKGAYGEVYLARNAIGLLQAVKVIYRADFNDADPYEREFRGIQSYMPVSMNHPSLVHLLHVGRNDEAGYFYYVMELGDDAVSGTKIDPPNYVAKTLAGELRQRQRLPIPECVRLFLALTEALHSLHDAQLIHRDIKPSNIIFVKGVPKFADIGLVTGIADPDHDVTYIGTEGYIAPEGPGTPAADVYSLGMVLYEAVTGASRHQFPLLPDALTEHPNRVALLKLNHIFVKACEHEIAARFRSAREMRVDLEELQRWMETNEK